MQTEARVGVVVDGTQKEGNCARKYVQQTVRQRWQAQQLGVVPEFFAGGVAGAMSKTCTAPLARLTILFQVQGMHADLATMRKTNLWLEARRVLNEEGARAFWKGNLVTVAHRIPYSSVSFYSFERYKHLLQSFPGVDSSSETSQFVLRLAGGLLAGVTASTATYPLDLVRTRLAAQTNVIYYRGIWHTLRTITREEGILGLYKGLGATLMSVGPNLAISFAVYETLKTQWQIHRPNDSTMLVSLACGSVSGLASSTVVFPLDLMRRRMQLEGAGGRACVYNSGVFGAFRKVIRTEGWRGLYRGILPEYCKVVPSVSIVFMTYETIKSFLLNYPSDR
ncbi:hypothetical protein Droror1_Dr00024240 [Drosera rotundifolia]